MAVVPPLPPGSGGFIAAFVVTFTAFASGMGVCLFNLDTVSECVAVARTWVDQFKAFGDHLIVWFLSVYREIKFW